MPKRVKRLMFISFVQEGAQLGLTSMVLEPRRRPPGSRAARDVEEPVGGDYSMERNQTEESKKCVPLLGPVAGG